MSNIVEQAHRFIPIQFVFIDKVMDTLFDTDLVDTLHVDHAIILSDMVSPYPDRCRYAWTEIRLKT